MSRDANAATLTASQAELVRPVVFVELDYASGAVRLHSGVGTLTWSGNSFTGAGELGSISAVQDSSDLSTNQITLSLSGIPEDSISLALSEVYRNRAVTLWYGLLDADHQLVADPTVLWKGRMDTQTVIHSDGGAVISVKCVNRLVDWQRPRVRRYNDADQQARYPGDRFFEFTEQMADKELTWGPDPDTRTKRGR